MAAVLSLKFTSSFIYDKIQRIFYESLHFKALIDINIQSFLLFFYNIVKYSALAIAPLLLAVFLASLFSNMAQVGFFVAWKAIEPKGSKIDPIKGLGRLFSMKSFFELIKSILKISIIFSIAYFAVQSEEQNLLRLYDDDIQKIIIFILRVSLKIFIWVLIAMVILAIMDYLYQKWEFEKNIKMSMQEIKDEMKQTEGDPMVKSRIRQLQAEAARNRMMSEVPSADVIVTNPTHLAVALKYDQITMGAPVVLAKGAGKVAERIKAIAGENDIPVIEQPELARKLFKIVDIGEEVPSDLFQAVAEILAYVYKLKGRV